MGISDEWRIDAAKAIAQLGGKGRLKDIYPLVHARRAARGAPLGEYKAWTRNAIQNNSRGKGIDIFEHIDRGVWGLKTTSQSPHP